MSKPQYVQEVEQNTGLECVPVTKKEASMLAQEYWVMSPTGLKLFRIGSHSDDLIGMISQPEMYAIQGVSFKERHARRRNI